MHADEFSKILLLKTGNSFHTQPFIENERSGFCHRIKQNLIKAYHVCQAACITEVIKNTM